MDENTKQQMKWLVTGGILLAAAYFFFPVLKTILWNGVSISIAAITLGAIYLFLPALVEWGLTGAYWLKQKAWATNPTITLRRDWESFNEAISKLEGNIAEVSAAIKGSRRDLANLSQDMTPEAKAEWATNIHNLEDSALALVNARDEMKARSVAMDRDIRALEAEWKMGRSLGNAVKVLNHAGQLAQGTPGTQVSIDTIKSRLDKSMAELEVIRSRKPADWNKPAAVPSLPDYTKVGSEGTFLDVTPKSSVPVRR